MASSNDRPHFSEVFTRAMPQDVMGKAKRMAADLAEGTLIGWWTEILIVGRSGTISMPDNSHLERYLQEIWQDHVHTPSADVSDGKLSFDDLDFESLLVKLIGMGYLTLIAGQGYVASEKAYDLLEIHSIEVFISYSVNENSSLAMLIWSELQRRGYSPFLDIRNLTGGDEWLGLLESKVKSSDVFIVLLGPKTLESDYVRKEIRWATEAKRTKIMPISVNGFQLSMLNTEFKHLLDKNIIRVSDNTSVEFLSMINQLIAGISLLGRP